MNKNKITCGTIFVCSLCVLLIGLSILIGGESEAQKTNKILSVAGNNFHIPSDFLIEKNSLGQLTFNLNAATLQITPKRDVFNFLAVDVMPADQHPGSFYLRKEGIEEDRCNYKIFKNYRVCEYLDTDRGRVQIFYEGDKIYLINNCILFGKEAGLNPTCQTWGSFLDGLKVAYSYPQIYNDKILDIDVTVKYLLMNFYNDTEGKKNGMQDE